MGIKDVITDRIRRLRGTDGLIAPIVAGWRELAELIPADACTPDLTAQVIRLRQRLDDAGGKADEKLVRDLFENQRQLMEVVRDLVTRTRMLGEGSRASRRAASAQDLQLAHFQDEIERVRNLIRQECRRRNIREPTMTGDASGLVDELYKLFEGISGRGSRRMQSAGTDPVLRELISLLESGGNTADIERFPRWLRQPATRLIGLLAERNRYRKLLESHNMLPKE